MQYNKTALMRASLLPGIPCGGRTYQTAP